MQMRGLTIQMLSGNVAENIIYYSICLFVSCLGLGITWRSVQRNYLIKVGVSLVLPAAVVSAAVFFPALFNYLDITYSLYWLGESVGQGGRLKMFVITCIFFLTVGYFVCLEHVAIASIKRITRRSTGRGFATRG